MKKLMLMAITATLALSPVWAGQRGHGHEEKKGEHMERRLDRMSKNLNLSPEQKSKIEAILNERADQMKAMHEEMKKLKDDGEAKIRAVLTPDQLKKYDEKKKNMKDKPRKGREKK